MTDELIRVCPSYGIPCDAAREQLKNDGQACHWACTITKVSVKEVLGHKVEEKTTTDACKLDALLEGTNSTMQALQQTIGMLMAMMQAMPKPTSPFPPTKMRGN